MHLLPGIVGLSGWEEHFVQQLSVRPFGLMWLRLMDLGAPRA